MTLEPAVLAREAAAVRPFLRTPFFTDGLTMINSDYSNPINHFLNTRANAKKEGVADVYKKIKDRQDAIAGKSPEPEPAKSAPAASTPKADALSSEERRQRDIRDILNRINAEEAQSSRTPAKAEDAAPATPVGSAQAPQSFDPSQFGFPEFLNDMPLFAQFKEDLINAYKSLDGATSGAISAQFELNYSSVEMIANAAGGYDVKETQFNFKLDLNYVKAASGKGSNASISDLFGVNKKNPTPTDVMSSIKDYFSPEKTADRIVDFSTAFFPNSSFFKAKGDTEESRAEFAEMMRNAIQKGFDQAMGKLGKVPSAVQEGIDKTHELTFKGIDDFVKFGMNRNQQSKDEQFYEALQAFSVQMSQSYSQKSYSLSAADVARLNQPAATPAIPTDPTTIDAEA